MNAPLRGRRSAPPPYINDLLAMYRAGRPQREIADHFGICVSGVQRWLRLTGSVKAKRPTPAQARILNVLAREGQVSSREIAERFRLAIGGVCDRLLDLHSKGAVERDGNAWRITPAGRDYLAKAEPAKRTGNVINHETNAERRALLESCLEVAANDKLTEDETIGLLIDVFPGGMTEVEIGLVFGASRQAIQSTLRRATQKILKSPLRDYR